MSDLNLGPIPDWFKKPPAATTPTVGTGDLVLPMSTIEGARPVAVREPIGETIDPETIIAKAPEPDKVRSVNDGAVAFARGLGVPMGSAFTAAKALAYSEDLKQKKFLQAGIDSVKAANLQMQIGELSYKLRVTPTTNEAKRKDLDLQIKALEDQLPNLADTEDAGFLRKMAVGAVGIAAQQEAQGYNDVVYGGGQLGLAAKVLTTAALMLNPTLSLRDRLRLVTGVGASATSMGRGEGGGAYRNMLNNGVPHEIAGPMSDAVGALSTAVEFGSETLFVSLFGPFGPKAKTALAMMSKRLGWEGAITQHALKVAAKVAAGFASEMSEELAQDTITFFGEQIAQGMVDEMTDAERLSFAEQMGVAGKGSLALVKEAAKRWGQVLQEAGPGMLGVALVPGLVEGFRAIPAVAQDVKAAKAPAKVETPVAPVSAETTRAAVEAAVTPAAKVEAVTQAEAAVLEEVKAAPEFTPALAEKVEELAEMREEAEATPEVAPVEAKAPVQAEVTQVAEVPSGGFDAWRSSIWDDVKAGKFHPEEHVPGNRDIIEGKEQPTRLFRTMSDKEMDAAQVTGVFKPLLPGDPDLYVTPDPDRLSGGAYGGKGGGYIVEFDPVPVHKATGRLIDVDEIAATSIPVDKIRRIWKWDAEAKDHVLTYDRDVPGIAPVDVAAPAVRPEAAVAADVKAGVYVPDVELGAYLATPWAQEELSTREAMKQMAEGVAIAGGDIDTFRAAVEDTSLFARTAGVTQKVRSIFDKSPDYLAEIWRTAPKPEGMVVDESGEVDVEASTDARIDNQIEAEADTPRLWYGSAKVDNATAALATVPANLWNPDNETVGAIADQWAEVVKDDTATDPETRDIIRKKKDLVTKLSQGLLKKPTAGIGGEATKKLRDLQRQYTPKETTALKKAKAAAEAWKTAHPGQAIPPETQAVLDRKSIRDLTVAELRQLYEEAMAIRKAGQAFEKARRAAIKERRVGMANKLGADLGYMQVATGEGVKRAGRFASQTTKKAEGQLKRKGWVASMMEDPLYLLEKLGAEFKAEFWDRRKGNEGTAVTLLKQWDRELRELYERTGVDPSKNPMDLLRLVEGKDYRLDDLLYYYGQLQDPDGRRAVLYGNDESEVEIARLVDALPQKYKDWLNGLIDLFNKHWPETAKVQIEQNGVSAPEVQRYLPMRRSDEMQRGFATELSTEASIREMSRMASLEKSWQKQRVKFKEGTEQKRIRTDLLNIIAEQVQKETRYIALEEMARDWGWLLGGRSKESRAFLEAMKQKYGKPMVDWLKDYANAVIRPEAFRGYEGASIVSQAFRNMNTAVLAFKVGSVIVQAEGPFRYLSQLKLSQWPYVFAGVFKSTFAPWTVKKQLQFMYEKSPVMQAMADSQSIDPALQEGRGSWTARSTLGLNLQNAKRVLDKAGFAGLKAANQWTIASGWTATYYAKLAETHNEKAAIKAADEATFRTQPSGNLADAPRLYWLAGKKLGPIGTFLLRFTRATNKMANMMTVGMWRDLTNMKTVAPGRKVWNPQFNKMLGTMLAFSVGAFLNGLRRRKRWPKDETELLEDGLIGLADTAGAMTGGVGESLLIGAGLTGTVRREAAEIKPYESAQYVGQVVGDVGRAILGEGEVTEKEIWRMTSTIMQLFGLAAPAAENIARSAYDFDEGRWRFDPIELLGRRLRGE